MKDLGLLLLRVTAGGLLVGHSMQKLTNKFEGHGLAGTGQFMESLGLQPGQAWATVAALSEAGGALMALGFLEPLGEIGVISAMAMATGKVHWGKPIWNTSGGAEQPVTYATVALALLLAGPGKLSLDSLLGTRLSTSMTMVALAGATAGVAYGMMQETPQQPDAGEQSGPPAEQDAEPQTETASGAI